MKSSLPYKKKFTLEELSAKVFPIIKQERTQSFLFILLTLLALIIFGLFAINPTLATIVQLHKQLNDNTFVYDKLQKKITNIISLQKKYNALQPDLPIVFAAIPDTFAFSRAIGQIQRLALDTNVLLISIQSKPITILPNMNTDAFISFSFTIQGDKQNILHFISALMSFERIIILDEVLINTNNDQTSKTLQATIQAKTFIKPF